MVYYGLLSSTMQQHLVLLMYADTDGPNSSPYIIDLFVESNDQFNDEGEAKPALPIPAWFRFLMVGPTADFQILHNTLLTHDDWGLTHEIHHYCDLDTEYADLCIKLKHLQIELDTIQQACSSYESRLQLTCTTKQVEMLKNVPCKT